MEENAIPLGSSTSILCPHFFGREGGHDIKQREHNFTKNNCVIAFKNVAV